MSSSRSVRCSGCGVTLAVQPLAPTVCCFRCRRTTYVGQNPVRPPANIANPGYQNQFMSSSGMQQFAHPTNSGFAPSYPRVFGKKKALLIGIQYDDLNGPINDVRRVASLLTQKFGFPAQSMLILTNKHREANKIPTKANMLAAMRWLVSGCTAGDSLVFYFSGHGGPSPDHHNDEWDGNNEAICPADFDPNDDNTLILDNNINKIMVRPLPPNVKLHAIFDTCGSGTGLDLPYRCIISGDDGSWEWDDDAPPSGEYKGTSGGLAVLISGCDDHQNSPEIPNTMGMGNNSTGVMTNSFIQVLKSGSAITYGHLLTTMRAEIHRTNAKLGNPSRQDAQLSSSGMFTTRKMPFNSAMLQRSFELLT